jgi:hypothetical protein
MTPRLFPQTPRTCIPRLFKSANGAEYGYASTIKGGAFLPFLQG